MANDGPHGGRAVLAYHDAINVIAPATASATSRAARVDRLFAEGSDADGQARLYDVESETVGIASARAMIEAITSVLASAYCCV